VLKIFLCHSSGDKPLVRMLRTMLLTEGFEPWLDEEDILPGQDWDLEIRRAIRQADLILVCLSQDSVTKSGYVQKEIRFALDVAKQPEGAVFVIPARLEECEVPERMRRWQWVDLFDDDGYGKLARSLRIRAGVPQGHILRSPNLLHETLIRNLAVSATKAELDDSQRVGGIQYHGLYVSPESNYFQYFRFYPDGTVLSVSSTGTAKQVSQWLTRDNAKSNSAGAYLTSDENIQFSTVSPSGRVDYVGRQADGGWQLLLHSHSHINGHESYGVWRFEEIKDLPPR
jgi:hypothetical protein